MTMIVVMAKTGKHRDKDYSAAEFTGLYALQDAVEYARKVAFRLMLEYKHDEDATDYISSEDFPMELRDILMEGSTDVIDAVYEKRFYVCAMVVNK